MTGRAIAVVGAGIVGCLIARELARSGSAGPDATITVLDRDLAGSGTTRRSAGLALAKGATPRTRQMSAFSQRYYDDLAQSDPRLPFYPARARVIAPGGLADAGYLAEARPAPAPAGIAVPPGQQAWQLGGCHYADVYALTQAIAASLRSRVRFAESAEVTGLRIGEDQVTLRCATGERLTADQVVLAPGPWLAAPAWAGLLSPLGLRVKKIVAMHIERRPEPGDEVIIFEADDAFLLPVWHRGHWLFSYTCTHWDVDPDAVPCLSRADLAEARDCLRRYSPELAEACASGRVCCDAYSPAREPVVTALAGGKVVFAGGASGSGYRLAPAIAAQAVAVLSAEGATDDHQHV